MKRSLVWTVVASLIMVLLQHAEAGRLVAGLSSLEEFSDPQLAGLADAACSGDISTIEQMVRIGASPNGIGRRGETPLIWAVWCGNLAGVEALLRIGGNPNYVVPHENSATFAAATSHDPSLLKLLLKYKGDPNAYAKDDLGNSALFRSIVLIENGYGADNFQALLAAGANVNQVGPDGRSVAFYAALGFRYDLVAILLEHGFSYNLPQLAQMISTQKVGGARASEISRERTNVLRMLKSRGIVPS